jgi:hypothetical protein
MLAVAHTLSALLARADGPSRAELAAALRMTTARLSQILDLTLLAPDIQEEIAFRETAPGRDPVPERAVRYIVRAPAWSEQRRRWRALVRHGGSGTRDHPWAGGRAGAATGRPSRARPASTASERPATPPCRRSAAGSPPE